MIYKSHVVVSISKGSQSILPELHFTLTDESFKNIGQFVALIGPIFDIFTNLKIILDVKIQPRVIGR